MPERELPTRPNLEQYKKQAKDLVKDRANAEPEAFARIRHHHPRLRDLPDLDLRTASFKLADAQLIIAREHAFESWSKFARHIQVVQPAALREARVPVDGIELDGEIAIPERAAGLVLFVHASSGSRYNPRNRFVAEMLHRTSFGTVVMDLMTEEEELADIETDALRHDIRSLGRRIVAITDWIGKHSELNTLSLGYLGFGASAAAAVFAAAQRPNAVQAFVSCGGRPDLAGPWFWQVQAPALIIIGSKDTVALGFSHSLMGPFPQQADRKLAIVDGATQLFEEPAVLEKAGALARDWFRRYLVSRGAVSR